MFEFLASLVVVVLGILAFTGAFAQTAPAHRRILWAGFALHVGFAFAQTALYTFYYRGGDAHTYFRYGERLATWASYAPLDRVPDLFSMILLQKPRVPLMAAGLGSTTGAMFGAAALLSMVTGGSIWAGTVLAGMGSFAAQAGLARAMLPLLPADKHEVTLRIMLLLPSTAFWTSGFVKETFATAGLALAIHGGLALHRGAFFTGPLRIAAGVTLAICFKPFGLLPLVVAAGVWTYWQQVVRNNPGRLPVRPIWLLVGIGVGFGGVLMLTSFYPDLGPERITETIVSRRNAALMETGGSSFQGEAARDTSPLALLRLAPEGLIAVFFRPFLFEARNPVMLVSALEMTVVTILLVRVVARQRVAGVVQRLLASPELMFCFSFSLVFALGIGLTYFNLGSISRYRAPAMTFYVLQIALLWTPERARARLDAPRPKPARLAPRLARSAVGRGV